jgi:peptide/nickel transport system substrate-binding protein
MFVGCGGEDEATPTPVKTAAPTKAPTAAPTPTPDIPHDVVIAVPSLLNHSFDGTKVTSTDNSLYGFLLFDPFVGALQPGGVYEPGIAESWERTADGMTWTFHLREGVKFHDGTECTAADVVFSMEALMSPEVITSDARIMRSQIDTFEIVDDYTLVIHLKVPAAELWKGMEAKGAGLHIMPKDYVEKNGWDYFNEHPIGTGPWKLIDQDFGQYMLFESVGNFRQQPEFDTLKLIVVPEDGTRIAMLKTGVIDMASISPDRVDEVKAAGKQVWSYAAGDGASTYLYWDMNNPDDYALGDIRVRKALAYAINREELAEELFGGYAAPLGLAYASPDEPWFDAEALAPYPYDPDESKRLLAEAGYPNGFDMKINTVAWAPWMVTLNEAISGYWDKIGVRAEIRMYTQSAINPLMAKEERTEIWGSGTTYKVGYPNGFQLKVSYYTPGYHRNHNNQELNDLILQVEQTMDAEERVKLAREAAIMAYEEYTTIPSLVFDDIWGVSNRIAAWDPYVNVWMPAMNFGTLIPAE